MNRQSQRLEWQSPVLHTLDSFIITQSGINTGAYEAHCSAPSAPYSVYNSYTTSQYAPATSGGLESLGNCTPGNFPNPV